MTNYELAKLLEDMTLAACQEADGVPHNPFREALRSALLTSNTALGSKGVSSYDKHVQMTLADSHHVLRDDLYEMRSILLETPFGEELRDSGADCVPVCLLIGRDPNACAFRAPDDKPVVQIEWSLQTWLIFANRLLIRCAERGSDKAQRKQEFLQHFRSWTELKFSIRVPDVAAQTMERYVATCAEPFANIMSVKMVEWQKFWVFAHELAHISLGHLSEPVKKSIHIGENTYDVEYYVRSQQQEYDADIRATEYMFATHEWVTARPDVNGALFPETTHAAAPFVVLMYFSYLQMLRWKPGEKWISTHPMAKNRIACLGANFGNRVAQCGESCTLIRLAEEMILKASYLVFDELGQPRPGPLPPELDINWGLGDRVD